MICDAAKLDALGDEVRCWLREVAWPNAERGAAEQEIPDEIVAEVVDKGFSG